MISVFRRSGLPADHHSHDVLRNDNLKLLSSSIGILDLVTRKSEMKVFNYHDPDKILLTPGQFSKDRS